MQHEGKPNFIRVHSGAVKGVSISPRDQYIFCSGGQDGKVYVYNALQGQRTGTAKTTSPMQAMKSVNAVKYNADGTRILATNSKRLSIIDSKCGSVVYSYEHCAYTGKDRTPLATDPHNPNMAICACANGKGLITFDLRIQQPIHFALNVHASIIKDIIYLDQSWPFGAIQQGTVASLGADGVCKVRTIDDRVLDWFDVKHKSNCLTATPGNYYMSGLEPVNACGGEGFESLIMIGGECLSEYVPAPRSLKYRLQTHIVNDKPYNKLKYTSNGHLLYAATSGGQIKRYCRMGRQHRLLGMVFSHEDAVLDMDISHNDEYLVSGSRDGSVGVLCLGAPSFGWTGFMELA